MSLILNSLIFGITALLLLRALILDRKGKGQSLKLSFRFFTVQSNLFCGLASLCMLLAPEAEWAWLLKYMGTSAVSLTFFTVLFYLAPAIGSFTKLIREENLFMHFLTPLMALASFCIWERRGMGPWIFLWGMLPILLYGSLYLRKVVFDKTDKAWDDLYGFNRKGRWPLALCAMLSANLIICLCLSAVQNMG